MAVTPATGTGADGSALLNSALSPPRADLSDADAARDRAHAPVRRAASLQARRNAVRDRQARTRHVRGAVRPCRDHPARRPRPCHAGHRPGAGTVSRRDRPALGPRRAGRRPCRRRRRNAVDSAGAIARAAGRRSRSRRAHHARADPAPGQPDPGRRRRSGADRAAGFERRHPPAELSHPQRHSASSARSGQGQRRRRTDRALFAVAVGLAAGGDGRRHRASQSRAKPNSPARSA